GRYMRGENSFYHFLGREFTEQVIRMCKYGRRSVNWSTIAPTGSLSILTQTSSGCEPLFQPYYMRRKKINPNEEGVRVDFIDDVGDSWQEFAVVHPKFKDWINANYDEIGLNGFGNIEDLTKKQLKDCFEQSPWFKSTANDIDWI